jgi:serine kinase of HPr protein (carbohydrate metabolism regulator)
MLGLTLKTIVKDLNLKVMNATVNLDKDISGGYVSDLMSDVLANSKKGNIWVTLQTHQNIVAVATLKELAGIILVNSRKPEKDTLEKAEREGLPIMVTEMSAFEIVGKLYKLGIRGK